MQNEQTFSSKETCKLVSITYRQLDYWAREQIFVPTVAAQGSGSSREYSFTDLVELRVIKKMLDSGMKLSEVRRATDYIHREGHSLSDADLVMTSDRVFLHDSNNPQSLIDLIQNGQGVFTIVALSQAASEVRDQLEMKEESSEDSAQVTKLAIA